MKVRWTSETALWKPKYTKESMQRPQWISNEFDRAKLEYQTRFKKRNGKNPHHWS